MAIEIREDSLNSGSLQSGLGVPTHLASTGTLFTDKNTGIIYINKNGSSLWSNISTSAATGGGSITSFAYSPTNNTFSIVESGVTYSATINSMSGLTVSGNLTVTGTVSGNIFTGSTNTISGTRGRVVTSGSSTTAFITVSGSNTLGGANYVDFIRVTNTFVGATNINKTIRLDSAGAIEFLNSAYSALTFSIADNGFVNITSPASTSSNIAVRNALNVGTNGQLFDDGNFHVHANTGTLWLNSLEGGDIRLGTQTNKGTSSVIVDTSIVGHSFFTKVQSGFNVAFGTEISMDNLKVRINGTGGSDGLVQAGAVSGSFSAYSTLLGNVAGSALRGDTNSAGITFTTSYQDISSAQATLAAGGDVTTLHLIDTTNSRIYRITAIHCQGTTGGYTSIERMA